MIILCATIIVVFWLAWCNGANDNFKGVATLYGSASTTYRKALIWATLATLAGGLMSVVLAHGLVKTFSGAGLIDAATSDPIMLTTIGAAAAVTIFLATLLGMPTSTTHALTGALVGAGLVAGPAGIHWDTLLTKFAQPLLLSPILAVGATVIIYPLLHRLRRTMGIGEQTCICLGQEMPRPVTVMSDGTALLRMADGSTPLTISIDETTRCVERYAGRHFGMNVQTTVDIVHWVSSGAVCFARAVNDTPKIAALLLAAGASGALVAYWKLGLVAAAMALGGLLSTRKVAETMSKRITDLNPGQGLTSSLVTAFLVLIASRFGVPVSTTHVSCGSIFGIGMVSGTARWRTIGQILLTWVTTLPMGALLGAGAFWILSGMQG